MGCISAPIETVSTSTPIINEPTLILPTSSPIHSTALSQPSPTAELTGYEFPDSINPAKRYLFYLHGKIIEDQGIQAVSAVYGEYEYEAILKKLESYGLVIISERRSKNTDIAEYAQRIVRQITLLLNANVPPEYITVVGASKGAYIAATVSHLLKNEKMNFVLLGSCSPDMIEEWKQNQMSLYGNILAIYDSVDYEYAGSCKELYTFSEGKGIARHDEIVLHIGTGHGILYKPLDEWILPTVQWANNRYTY